MHSHWFTYLQHIEGAPPVMNSPNENIAYYRIASEGEGEGEGGEEGRTGGEGREEKGWNRISRASQLDPKECIVCGGIASD